MDSPSTNSSTSSLTPYCLHPYPPVGYWWVAFDSMFSKVANADGRRFESPHCRTNHLACKLGPKAPSPGGFFPLPTCGSIHPRMAGNPKALCPRSYLLLSHGENSGSPPCNARFQGLRALVSV